MKRPNAQLVATLLAVFVVALLLTFILRAFGPRIESLQGQVTEAEQRANRLSAEVDALTQSRDELNEIIAKAVARGIRQGLKEANR